MTLLCLRSSGNRVYSTGIAVCFDLRKLEEQSLPCLPQTTCNDGAFYIFRTGSALLRFPEGTAPSFPFHFPPAHRRGKPSSPVRLVYNSYPIVSLLIFFLSKIFRSPSNP